jgi:hypothetical protein
MGFRVDHYAISFGGDSESKKEEREWQCIVTLSLFHL